MALRVGKWRARFWHALNATSSELGQTPVLLRAYARDRRGTARGNARVPALAVLALIGACSFLTDNSLSGWNPFFSRGESAMADTADAPFPNLADVPARPAVTMPGVRARVTEGLIADRTLARYTAEAIRLQSRTDRTVSRPKSTDLEPAAGEPRPAMANPVPAVVPIQAQATPAAMQPEVPPRPQIAQALADPAKEPIAPPSVIPQTAVAAPAASEAEISPVANIDRILPRSSVRSPAAVALPPQLQLATIFFAHNSSRLNQQDMDILRQVASVQRQYGGALHVVGHASGRTNQLDSLRHRTVNLRVSLNRASAVALALSQLGVPSSLLSFDASGDSQPVFAETMPTGEAGNRRAEVYLIR